MNINATSFEPTIRFSEPAAAIDISVAEKNSQAAVETKRPVENSGASADAKQFSGDKDRGQNLDIQV
ncbi:hypothetical protein [Kiloniella majae]|uniref:hypothetical protein n=1 Tax=Kiloniella majae TaxID=1938558 RepID=UPI000A278445|nr:hypothetical protein [Kiloniella majae]